MKRHCWVRLAVVALALLCASLSRATARPARLDDDEIRTRFSGDISLQQLSAGEPGQGVLLYYLDQSGPERPSLAVRLAKQPGSDLATAEVFDAPSGKTYVPIRVEGERVIVDQALRPTIEIRALGGWWVRDGAPNYNLDIRIDDPVYAMWGAKDDPKFGPVGWADRVAPGQPAVSISVRDPERSGLPRWDLRSLLPALPGYGFYRTNYAERTCATPTDIDMGVSPLWPYVARAGKYEQAIGQFHPPIVVDWARGEITHFAELVTVRHQSCSYALYAINRLAPGAVNRPNFESPFAFYDLSGQGAGSPNMILRTERFPADDPWSIGLDPQLQAGQPIPRDFETVRYSWRNAVGDGRWDYKIEVLGFHPYTSETPIAGGLFRIDAPGYDEFPAWVVRRRWPAVTFVDTEGSSYQSTEGIYEWSPRELGIGYIFGWHDEPDQAAFRAIPAGFRGEYRLTQELTPTLYLSPIDGRLHLAGAEGGLWNLGDNRQLRVHNIDGDRYIDGWTRERAATTSPGRPGEVEEALYALRGYLLYSGRDEAELRQVDYRPAAFEIAPPTDKRSWQAFRDQLAPYTSGRPDPNDLRRWASRVSGPTLTITGGRITDLRAIESGFRFILTLRPGFRARGGDPLDLRARAPGDYMVTYTGRFSITPLTPPDLSATLAGATSLTELHPGALQLALHNAGLQDVSQATLELMAAPPYGQPTVVVSQPVTLPGQSSIAPALRWTPPSAGEWTLTPRVRWPDGRSIELAPVRVMVRPARALDPGALFAASAGPRTGRLALLALIAFAAAVALIFWRQWRAAPESQVEDAP